MCVCMQNEIGQRNIKLTEIAHTRTEKSDLNFECTEKYGAKITHLRILISPDLCVQIIQ